MQRVTCLSEDVLYSAHQATAFGAVVDLSDGVEFLEEFALALGELRRRLNFHFDEEIATATTVQDWYSLLFQPEAGGGLCALGNLQHAIALERGNLDLGAKSSLRIGDGYHAVEILPFAFEERMFFDVKDDVHVAVGASVRSRVTVTVVENSRAFFDSGRHFDFQLRFRVNSLLASASLTRIGYENAGAMADGACARNTKETLLVTDLTSTLALLAGAGSLSSSRAGAFALGAGFAMTYRDFLRNPEDRFLEGEGEVFTQVVAALRARATSTAAAESIGKPKKITKNIGEVLEVRGVKATEATLSAANSGMAELVVARALIAVAQDGVSFATLLELLLRIRIIGIAVRVILHRELAIRTLDLDLGGCARDTEDLVIVSLGVRCQGYFS